MLPLAYQVPILVGPNAGVPDAILKAMAIAEYVRIFDNGAGDLVKLWTNNFTPDKDSVPGDFTEPTLVEFPDYLAVAVPAVGLLGRDGDGNWEQDALALVQFAVSATVNPAPLGIQGAFTTNAAGTILKSFYKFDSSIGLENIGDQIILLLSVKVSE